MAQGTEQRRDRLSRLFPHRARRREAHQLPVPTSSNSARNPGPPPRQRRSPSFAWKAAKHYCATRVSTVNTERNQQRPRRQGRLPPRVSVPARKVFIGLFFFRVPRCHGRPDTLGRRPRPPPRLAGGAGTTRQGSFVPGKLRRSPPYRSAPCAGDGGATWSRSSPPDGSHTPDGPGSCSGRPSRCGSRSSSPSSSSARIREATGVSGSVLANLPFIGMVLAFDIVGVLIATRRPGNSIGWIVLAIGFSWALGDVIGGIGGIGIANGWGGLRSSRPCPNRSGCRPWPCPPCS